jgi:hypothetical protein
MSLLALSEVKLFFWGDKMNAERYLLSFHKVYVVIWGKIFLLYFFFEVKSLLTRSPFHKSIKY